MTERELGKSGLKVSAIGLGCMGMSEFYDPAQMKDEESVRVIHRYFDAGGNFLDTADVYGMGRNEVLVGTAIRGQRDKVVLATKFANVRSPKGEFLGVRGDPQYVRESCDASLKRLGVEVIDLYYQHRVDPKTPIEDTVGAMAELVREGKVRYLGLSEVSPATIRRAAKVHPIAALQTEYSLWSREPEAEILPTVRELGIGFVAYSPLGRAFLTGQRSVRRLWTPLSGYDSSRTRCYRFFLQVRKGKGSYPQWRFPSGRPPPMVEIGDKNPSRCSRIFLFFHRFIALNRQSISPRFSLSKAGHHNGECGIDLGREIDAR
jgi:aryl-alcohol dehydrogenase-like predicted oxidoreductase